MNRLSLLFVLIAILPECSTTSKKVETNTKLQDSVTAVPLDSFSLSLQLEKPLDSLFVNDLLNRVKDRYVDQDQLKNFSVVPLSSAGGHDVLFCSNIFSEGPFLWIFRFDDDYVKPVPFVGQLVDINYADSVLVIYDKDCCAGETARFTFIRFSGHTFQETAQIHSTIEMSLPEPDCFLKAELIQDSCILRTAPIVNDSTEYYYILYAGNPIGSFPKHSSAVSLKTEIDSLQEKWAFVIVDAHPYESVWIIEDDTHHYFAGWVKCSDLQFSDDQTISWPNYLFPLTDYVAASITAP